MVGGVTPRCLHSRSRFLKYGPKTNGNESMENVVPVDGELDCKLLTAMRTDWPSFAQRIECLAAECKGM